MDRPARSARRMGVHPAKAYPKKLLGERTLGPEVASVKLHWPLEKGQNSASEG